MDIFTQVANPVHGTDHSRSTRTEHLHQSTILRRIADLCHGHGSLRHGEFAGEVRNVVELGGVLAGEGEDAVACDAGEDHAVEWGCDELVGAVGLPEDDEHVHGADLGKIVLGAVEPEILGVSKLSSLLLGEDAWGVVDSELVGTSATGSSAHVFRGAEERDRLEALGVVGANGGEDDEEKCFVRWAYANGLLSTDWRDVSWRFIDR